MSVSHKASKTATNLTRISLISEETTHLLSQQFHLTREEIAYSLPKVDLSGTLIYKECPYKTEFPCQPKKYRAYNGYCNNVQHPRWGVANTRYLRYLMPIYGDGVSSSRRGMDGNPLPSSRQVSLSIHMDKDRPHNHLMALTAIWAELVAKDLSQSVQFSGYLESAIKCCGVAFDYFHSECYPIKIDVEDPYYSRVGDNCQEYVRSSIAPRVGCTLGKSVSKVSILQVL